LIVNQPNCPVKSYQLLEPGRGVTPRNVQANFSAIATWPSSRDQSTARSC